MVEAEFMTKFMDKAVKDIAADIGLVRLCVVESLPDADIAVVRIGAAIVSLAQFGADNFHPIRYRIKRRIGDEFKLQRRDRGPHRQSANGCRLICGMVAKFLNIDP